MTFVSMVKKATEVGSCMGSCSKQDPEKLKERVLVIRFASVELRLCNDCAEAFKYAVVDAVHMSGVARGRG